MRKTQKNIIVLAVLALALVAFCACGVIASATAIKISSYPKTSYTTSDADFDWTGFKLAITTSDGNNTEYTYDQLKNQANFTVSAFDNSVGTHTATITYQTLEATFQYTVAAGTFAGGEGTQANPYQISTVEQFKNIGVNDNYTYFKLINDLDMADYTTVSLIKNAEIDGDGYSIKNLKTSLVNYLVASTFKNVDIYINMENENAVFNNLGNKDSELVLIENINVYGVQNFRGMDSSNTGILVYCVSTQLCRIKDVNIYASLLSTAKYTAIFVGYTNYNNGDLYFENAKFYGYAEGERLGIFTGNTVSGFKDGQTYADDCRHIYVDENSGNYGTIITTMGKPQAFLFGNSTDNNPQKDRRVTIKKNDVELTTEENASFFNKAGSTAKQVYEASLKLTKDSNGALTIACTNENVKAYRVVATIWTLADTGYTNTFTLINKTFDKVGTTGIYVAEWKYKAEQEAVASDYDATNNCYYFNLGFTPEVETFGTNAKSRKNNVQYTVFAYDESGKTLGAYMYVG